MRLDRFEGKGIEEQALKQLDDMVKVGHSLTDSFTNLLTLTLSLTRTFTHALTHALNRSLAHSFTHSFTHSLSRHLFHTPHTPLMFTHQLAIRWRYITGTLSTSPTLPMRHSCSLITVSLADH